MAELRLENSIVDERYYVERCLGRGSYAEIFLAFDQEHGDLPVIIKALNATLQGTPDVELKRTLVENFQNEAVALDNVRHPNIIRRLGHGSAADLEGTVFHYLVLEYMAGGDLLSLCNKRPFTLEEALYYFQQVAEALAYAHSQHVIHRDIKPKNLLLSADHQVIKIADFGVAKMTLDAPAEITRVGTDIYAPPEHHPDMEDGDDGGPAEGEEKLTPSADVYSLAKTIYAAMTGRAPRQFSRRPITSLPPELADRTWGEALLRILRKATATRAAERYATVQGFWQEFAALQKEAAEDDVEKTRVRARLKVTSDVEQPSSQPNFQAVVATVERSAQPARIVVELPQRAPEPARPPSGTPPGPPNGQPQNRQPEAAAPKPPGPPPQNVAVNQAAVQKRTRVMGTPVATVERGPLDRVRAAVKSDWLRRVFVVFLVATLAGLIASTYFYFAGDHRAPAVVDWFDNRDGEISGASFVHLRSEPSIGSRSLRWLPKGTKIRALERTNGWVRVKITYVPPTELPVDAPKDRLETDTGWIKNSVVQY